MRIRVNKLVYLPVGGALGAGLLVSAFVVPQPKLSASQDCYSACRSATSLSLSRSTVGVGNGSDVEFRVKVTGEAFGTAKPTGSVDVETDGRVLCHFHLSGGAGRCSLGDKELAAGSYEIAAHYSGDDALDPSISRREHLEVTKRDSRTALSLSRSTVTVGRESAVEFRVRVTADAFVIGKATGSVDVETDGKVLCHFHLADGAGHCSPGNRELRAGSYEIAAHYSGDDALNPSTSRREHLTVRRP